MKIREFNQIIWNLLQTDEGLSRMQRLRLRNLKRYEKATILFYGKSFSIVDVQTFRNSYYEIFKTEIFKFNTENKSPLIIDCGSNIGLGAIYLKMRYPEAKIIAFEPDSHIFKALVKNLLAFGYDDIICRNEAISDKDRMVNFWLEGGHSGMILPNEDKRDTVQVKAIRLKSLLDEFENITFLKIDIEGEEIKVIHDIADQLYKVDFLLFEYHSFMIDFQELGELLTIVTAAGLRYYIKEAVEKVFPFIEREKFLGMDMLVNVFCYR